MKVFVNCLVAVMVVLALVTAALSQTTGPTAASGSTSASAPATQPSYDVAAIAALAAPAPPLGEPAGEVITVSSERQLQSAINAAADHTTIVIADGTYKLTGTIYIDHKEGLTIRSLSGRRDSVILDGQDKVEWVFDVRGGRDITIAGLNFQNATRFGIRMLGDSDVDGLHVSNCVFHNIWVRMIKGTHPARPEDYADHLNSPEYTQKIRPRNGSIRYCLFLNDHPKTNANDGFHGDYVAAIDMMMLKDWVISDNVFIGIRGRNGAGRGAIFVWVGSEGVTAERNVFFDCDRSIAYGNPSGDCPLHMTGGIIRNNFIVAGSRGYAAVELARTSGCQVYNNTVLCPRSNEPAIHVMQRTENDLIVNNILMGEPTAREGATYRCNYLEYRPELLLNPAIGDLHLKSGAADIVGTGEVVPGLTDDFSGRPRRQPPVIGADEDARSSSGAASVPCATTAPAGKTR